MADDVILVKSRFVRAVWRGVALDSLIVPEDAGSLHAIAAGTPASVGDRFDGVSVVPLEDVALVTAGVVTQVWRSTPIESLVPGQYNGTLYPVAAALRVAPGLRHVGGEFLPALPDLPFMRETALTDLVSWLDAITIPVTGAVPQAERDSWAVKEASARAFVGGSPSPQQVADLTAEAAQTGETVAALAARIVDKADAWRTIAAGLSGVRRRAAGDMRSADSVEAIRAVVASARTAALIVVGG